jgi:hypothetical protein
MSICDCNQGRLPCSCKPVMEPCQLVARPSQQGRTYEALVQANEQVAALREELAKLGDDYCKRMDELTAAEQRNAELVELLEHAYGAIDENDGWRQLCQRILAVIQPDSIGLIKPTESGASE